MYRRLTGRLADAGAVLLAVLLLSGVALADDDLAGGDTSRVSQFVGADFRISGAAALTNDWAPTVAWNDTESEYLVVWPDYRNFAARGWDLYGRRLEADGTRIGPDFRISGPNGLGDESTPELVWNETDNEYLVVFMDPRNPTRGWDIFGQRLAPDGSRIGNEFLISGPGATADDWWPEVVWNGIDNEYLVVWEDYRNDATRGHDIYGRLVGADGIPAGGDFRISGLGAAKDDSVPDLAWNGIDNEYLVVWEDERNWSTREDDVYGRLVRADGVPAGGDFRVSGLGAVKEDREPIAVWNGTDNQYLVAWVDNRNSSTRASDIYGRLLGADGGFAGSDFRICGPGAVTNNSTPAAAWDATDNRYLVVWEDWRNDPTHGHDIYGRRLGADGAPAGGDFRINGPGAIADDWFPEVVWNAGADQYLVVWMDGRNIPARGNDIYGRRVVG